MSYRIEACIAVRLQGPVCSTEFAIVCRILTSPDHSIAQGFQPSAGMYHAPVLIHMCDYLTPYATEEGKQQKGGRSARDHALDIPS